MAKQTNPFDPVFDRLENKFDRLLSYLKTLNIRDLTRPKK